MASIGGVPATVKQWAVHVDGVGLFGMAKDFDPPKLKEKVDKFTAGGVIGDISVPLRTLEAMEAKITFASYNAGLLSLWSPGAINGTILTLRAAQMDSDGAVESIEIRLRGAFRNVEFEKFERGKQINVPMGFQATAYKLTMDGVQIHDVDMEEPRWIVGGVDMYAGIKDALGM